MQNLLWRACLNALPTKSKLHRKKRWLTTQHALFVDKNHKQWSMLYGSAYQPKMYGGNAMLHCSIRVQKCRTIRQTFKDIVEEMFGLLDKFEMEEFLMISWKIWKMRNEFVLKDEFTHPNKIVQLYEQLLRAQTGWSKY